LATEHVERRLAAVLAADVAGYSRLMGNDEEGTLARLKFLRKTLIDPAIASHRGRIVKTTGDGVLVEFASAVDAARSSAEVQRRMAEQNAAWPQEQRIQFRIGIHVGDIIIDDNDIFGDGVNIAARLEGIAEPGGVCISDASVIAISCFLIFSFDDDRVLQADERTAGWDPVEVDNRKRLMGGDGAIGEGQLAALPLPDHGLDGLAEKPACGSDRITLPTPRGFVPDRLGIP
jgi:class 3 adenylate cyclase